MKYFPFDGTPYKPQLGLKPLELKDWLEVDEQYSQYIERKKDLLANELETVFQFRDEASEAARELHHVLKNHITQFHPELKIDPSKPMNGKEAFFNLSTWTQEDWAILSSAAPVKLVAGSVCFPSRWSLREKMNQESGFIHAPVPKFDSIAKPTQNFLERISVDRPAARLNWTIHDSPELFVPAPHPAQEGLTPQNVIEKTFVRIERQTLRRLPETQAVVFSIRTYIHPMAEATKSRDRREKLLATLESLDADTIRYKGMIAFYEALKTALAKK